MSTGNRGLFSSRQHCPSLFINVLRVCVGRELTADRAFIGSYSVGGYHRSLWSVLQLRADRCSTQRSSTCPRAIFSGISFSSLETCKGRVAVTER